MIERFEISFAPSASVYAALRRKSLGVDADVPERNVGSVRGVVAFGAPERPRRPAWRAGTRFRRCPRPRRKRGTSRGSPAVAR